MLILKKLNRMNHNQIFKDLTSVIFINWNDNRNKPNSNGKRGEKKKNRGNDENSRIVNAIVRTIRIRSEIVEVKWFTLSIYIWISLAWNRKQLGWRLEPRLTCNFIISQKKDENIKDRISSFFS